MCLHKFDATGLSEGGICLLNLFSTDYLTNKLRGRILGTVKLFFGQAYILKSYQEPMTLKLGVVHFQSTAPTKNRTGEGKW